jgi:hypothetical protein
MRIVLLVGGKEDRFCRSRRRPPASQSDAGQLPCVDTGQVFLILSTVFRDERPGTCQPHSESSWALPPAATGIQIPQGTAAAGCLPARNPTFYGTRQGIETLVDQLHQAGINLHIDTIIKHSGFTDRGAEGFVASGGYPGMAIT